MTEDARNKELTQAYRDLATEETPAGLDERVLQMAARETRSRYGIARAWVRPVAWAAMIGLSLAIVLEVTQVIPSASGPDLARPDAAETPATVGAARKVAPNPGGGGAEERVDRREIVQNAAEAKETRSVELDDADAFAARDMLILEEAEMQARQRAGEPAVATVAAAPTDVVDTYCDASARETADRWYECIEELREAGEEALATLELEALRSAYPDFKVPAPDK